MYQLLPSLFTFGILDEMMSPTVNDIQQTWHSTSLNTDYYNNNVEKRGE